MCAKRKRTAARRQTARVEDVESLARRCERLESLYHVGKVLHSTLDPQQALDLIVRESVRLTRASSGHAALLNPTTGLLEVQSTSGVPAGAQHMAHTLREGITGWVVRTGKPERVPDVTTDKRYVALRPGVRSELAVPLQVEGEVRGVLVMDGDAPEAFTREDQKMLEALAEEAAAVIRNTWLYEQIRLKARLLEALAAVGKTVNSVINLDEALQVVAREAAGLVSAKLCSLMLLDASGGWLAVRASFGAGSAYLDRPPLNVQESFVGVAVRLRKPLQLENVQESGQYQHTETAKREGIVSLLTVPLLFSGSAIGALNVYTGQRYSFSNEEIRVFSAFADLAALAIERARLYERVADIEERLRQNEKLSALGLLAAEVAHEIRNPLAVIKMLFHSLELKFQEGDPRVKDTQLMADKIEHLNQIVDRILAFARTTEPRLVPLDLNLRIGEVLLLVRHRLRQQGIELVQKLDQQLPQVVGDATQLDQALLNLVLNASEAMAAGGALKIESSAVLEAGARMARVRISDTGSGMSPAQQQGAFKSLLSTSKPKGTGLGLAIVGKIVETHNGVIRIESKEGRGTCVTLLLPLIERSS